MLMSEFKAPEPLKSEERTLEDAMESMIVMMSRMYRNQVLLELNKGTVDKFADNKAKVLVNRRIRFADGKHMARRFDDDTEEYYYREETKYSHRQEMVRVNPLQIIDGDKLQFNDAQTGNYAAVLTKLANKTSKDLTKRFSNKRIKDLTTQVLSKNDKRAKKIFYENASKSLGIDPLTLMKKDGMTYDFNALVIETETWAQKLRDDTLEEYTANTLRSMTQGDSIEDILKQYDGLAEKRKNHAKFTARNQVANSNSIMNKTRAQKLGITKAVWVTSGDEGVRPSHEARDGKEFDLAVGLYSSVDGKTLLPGTDYQCRCGYRMIIDEDE